MPKGLEEEPVPKLTREEMLKYIRGSGLPISHISGHGPGTGLNPDITQLPDESLKAVYEMVKSAEEIQRQHRQGPQDNSSKPKLP